MSYKIGNGIDIKSENIIKLLIQSGFVHYAKTPETP
jgi:hypothetical protein